MRISREMNRDWFALYRFIERCIQLDGPLMDNKIIEFTLFH